MVDLKRTLDARGHSILEMPTGTGKTVTLLSLILSYQLYRPELAKLVYCTRTVGEMDKVLHELRRVLAHRDKCFAEDAPARAAASRRTLAVGLTTRRNLCLHPAVSAASSREEADALCRSMTASWARGDPEDIEDVGGRASRRGGAGNGAVVRMTDREDEDVEEPPVGTADGGSAAKSNLCEFFEGYDKEGTDAILPAGVYGVDDLTAFGKQRGWCPYYTARHALSFANVIVYNYQYLLDPKIAGLISRDLARECVVVFDEVRWTASVVSLFLLSMSGATVRFMYVSVAGLAALSGSLHVLVLSVPAALPCFSLTLSLPARRHFGRVPARTGSQYRQRMHRRVVGCHSRRYSNAEPPQPRNTECPCRVHQDHERGSAGRRVRAARAGHLHPRHSTRRPRRRRSTSCDC